MERAISTVRRSGCAARRRATSTAARRSPSRQSRTATRSSTVTPLTALPSGTGGDAAGTTYAGERAMNLGTFFIDAVIIHDVPGHATGSTVDKIVLSEVVSDIDQELKRFLPRA